MIRLEIDLKHKVNTKPGTYTFAITSGDESSFSLDKGVLLDGISDKTKKVHFHADGSKLEDKKYTLKILASGTDLASGGAEDWKLTLWGDFPEGTLFANTYTGNLVSTNVTSFEDGTKKILTKDTKSGALEI